MVIAAVMIQKSIVNWSKDNKDIRRKDKMKIIVILV